MCWSDWYECKATIIYFIKIRTQKLPSNINWVRSCDSTHDLKTRMGWKKQKIRVSLPISSRWTDQWTFASPKACTNQWSKARISSNTMKPAQTHTHTQRGLTIKGPKSGSSLHGFESRARSTEKEIAGYRYCQMRAVGMGRETTMTDKTLKSFEISARITQMLHNPTLR